MQDRDKQWVLEGSDRKRSRCLFMNSHFLAKLCQEPGGYDYSKVKRWTAARKLKSLAVDYYSGIEDLDKLVLPVHLGNHWVHSFLLASWSPMQCWAGSSMCLLTSLYESLLLLP
jgi:Ulp1 family protease